MEKIKVLASVTYTEYVSALNRTFPMKRHKLFDPETPVGDIYSWGVGMSKGTQNNVELTYVEVS